jgi:putative transposase
VKKRFTEEQIIKTIARMKAGASTKDLSREIGVTPTTLYGWRKRYKDMTVSEAKRMKELEHENAKLKKLVADLSLDNQMLKEVNSKKW